MCDVKKYNEIFQEIKSLSQDDAVQLILEAKTQEERDFYAMVGNFLLQKNRNLLLKGIFSNEKIYFDCWCKWSR